jgi:hypothetical protein
MPKGKATKKTATKPKLTAKAEKVKKTTKKPAKKTAKK